MPPPISPLTNYKWYPGHYVLLYGGNSLADGGLQNTLDKIAGTGANNIPNLIGIQKRYAWRTLERTKGVYDFSEILDDLQTCKDAGRYLRVFIQFKGFNGSNGGTPDWIEPGNPGYESGFGIGNYTWLTMPDGRPRNRHPAFWMPALKDRFVTLMTRLGQALDGGPSMPADDKRRYLSMVDINESSWGTVPGANEAEKVARQKAMCETFIASYAAFKVAAPTTILTHFLNFPNNASFSVLNDPVVGLPAALQAKGFAIGGPDNWLDDIDLIGRTADLPGVLKHYRNARGLTPICPSNQEANYGANCHDHQKNGPVDTDIFIQNLYDRATRTGTTYRGVLREAMFATHVNWAARTLEIGTTGRIPWNEVRDFFRNKWDRGADAGVVTPGVVTDVPSFLRTVVPPAPGALTLGLANDTGESATDKITSIPTLAVTGGSTGSTTEYSGVAVGPWETTAPTAALGTNTVYARQRSSAGIPGPVTAPLTFTYDNEAPALLRATVTAELVRITFTDALPLSELDTHKAAKENFRVTINGVASNVFGRFVGGNLKYYRLEMNPPAAVGQTVKVSYTQPTTGTLRIQDQAGNYAANFTDVVCNNLTGVPAPSTTATITKLGGVAPDGYTNQDALLIEGTLSAALAGYEELEVRKWSTAVNEAGETVDVRVFMGTATVTGTTWRWQDGHRRDGTYKYTAVVRNGELLGAWATDASITIDTTPPNLPSVDSAAYRVGSPFVVTGSWTNVETDVLTVSVSGTPYTTANGLVITGDQWRLSLPAKPVGRYMVGASVRDLAGNTTENDEPGIVEVFPPPSINELRLMFAKRAE